MNLLKKTLLLSLFLGSCSTQKNLGKNINNEVEQSFLSSDQSISSSAPSDNWWQEFNDPTLNKLIELGLSNNKDLKSASLAIETSRQLNNLDIAKLLPTGSASLGRQRFSSPGFGPNGIGYDIYQATFDAAWELDFFGKNLDRYRAGKLRFLKESQLYKASALRVTSEIAQNYIELKRVQKQLANLQKIEQLTKELNLITSKKEKNGVASKTDLHRSEIEANNSSSELISAQTEEKIINYRLAVLIGVMPEKMPEILNRQNQKEINDYYSGIVPVGLKSDILKRRPDIIAAEYEIDAADFDRSAQFKEFFPSFNLTATVGGGSKDFGEVLRDSTNVKDIRGQIKLPIFSIGQLIAEYKISKAKAKEAIISYEKTVLAAIEESESQITRYGNSLKVEDNAQKSLAAQQKILRIDQNKKRFGVISKEDLVRSEIATLGTENQFVRKKADSLVNLVALHKSIGGGFAGYQINFENDRVFMSEEKTEAEK